MLHFTRKWAWRIVALVALLVGLVGLALPVVPTVPFLIVSAWAASRGSPRLEQWLLTHPAYGPHIRAWREFGAVPRRAKWLASIGMGCSALALQFVDMPMWSQVGVPLVMAAIAVWLWSRPELAAK